MGYATISRWLSNLYLSKSWGLRKRRFTLFFAFVLAVGLTGTSYAQQADKAGSDSPRPVSTEQLSNAASDISVQTHQVPDAHMTARNTGSNELSSFNLGRVYVDANNHLFVLNPNYQQGTVDIYDGSSWGHLDVGEDIPAMPFDMTQNSSGEYWISTEDGWYHLNSDPALMDSVNVSPEDTLSNMVTHVEMDADGNIWSTHSSVTQTVREGGSYVTKLQKIGGLSLYMPSQDSLWYNPGLNSLTDVEMNIGSYTDLMIRSNGQIWAAKSPSDSGAGGIVVVPSDADTAWSYHMNNSNLPSNNVSALTEDDQGNIWTCFRASESDTTVGAAMYDGSSWTAHTQSNSNLKHTCSDIATTNDGSLYYANAGTLMTYNGSSWSAETGNIGGRPVTGVLNVEDGFNGQKVFGHSTGVYMKDGSDWSYISSRTDGGLFSNTLFSSTVDTAGNLWVSGFYGVGKYDGSGWTYYNADDGLAADYVWKMHAASDGTIWFGTTSGGLTYLKDGEFHTYNELNTFYGESIFEDSEGNIWFGSFGGANPGILKYDGSEFTHYDTTAGVIGTRVTSFAEGANGNIIASSNQPGISLAAYDTATGEWTRWRPESRPAIFSTEIASDNNGNVWIPSDSLYKWDGSTTTATGYPSDSAGGFSGAVHVEVDPEGNVWFGGSGSSIYTTDGTWQRPLSPKQGFAYGISHDQNGNAWLSTFGDGVFKITRSQAVPIEENNQSPQQFTLEQNYPNPFNPSTRISFSLPQAAQVQISVYDVIGRRVATLVNGRRQAGSHTVTFNAGNLSSGVYFYHLETANFTKTRKMMLVK